MTEQNDIGETQVSAQAFFDEMLVWELWSLKVWDGEGKDDERRENLQIIFDKYLSGKVLKRYQSRYDSLSFQDPPEFGEKITSAEKVADGHVRIYVSAGNLGGRDRYLMTYENGQWRIEARECDIGNTGKWVKELHI